MTQKQTYYSKEWENAEKYLEISRWVAGTPGATLFGCRTCKSKEKQLGNMGVQALKKHQKCATHQKNTEENAKGGLIQPTLSTSFSWSSSASSSSAKSQSTIALPSLHVKKTTILLALKCVMSHLSQRCIESFVELFPLLFPDSSIPAQLELKRTKLGYIIQFGLAVYYKKMLFSSLLPGFGVQVRFVSCFDEAFNRISKRKQMDVHVIYFDESKQKVVRSYIGSSFMGHAKADDTFEHFKDVHGDLDLTHDLTQISMDGPNVNWKTIKIIDENRKLDDPECNHLLCIGSCGLHVLHGAFGTAQKVAEWNVDKFCKNIFSIFKKSPARREDYLETNDLMVSHEDKDVAYLFPEKFCGHRWLENGKVLRRAISILPYLKKYFLFLKEKKKMPKQDNRFELVEDKQGNKLLLAELEFSLHISDVIEPFLNFFQAERPLAVFLFERLKELLCSLMEKFVRSEVLTEKSSVKGKLKIDLKKLDNLLPIEKVNIGHGANRMVRKATTVEALEVKKFRQSCRSFLVSLVEKLKERSPLCYPLTLYLSCLSPTQISAASTGFLTGLFNKLCTHFVDCNLISALCADRAEASYKVFIKSDEVKQKMKDFDENLDRLDDLYIPLLKDHSELRAIVKIVLILSHGNARVESGFSINEDMLLDNMKERSLVAYRTIYDGVLNEGGISNVDITKEMIKDVDGAHKRYILCLEENKQKQTAGEKRKLEKRKLTAEIKNAKTAKAMLTDDLQKKQSEVDSRIFQLEEELRKKR